MSELIKKTNIDCSIMCYLFLIFLIGCATTSELICGPVDTEILSDPAGVKIEIDNKYVGMTPLTISLKRECDWYNYTGAINSIVIKAEPVGSNQFTQYKIIEKSQPLPRRILFYMYQESSNLPKNLN